MITHADPYLMPTVTAISLTIIHLFSLINASTSAWWSPGHDVNGQPDCSSSSRVVLPQISALDRVQKKAAKFAHHTNISNWETLASRRKLSHICALFKAYSGEQVWKVIGDKLQRPHYLNRIDHEQKIRSRRQRMDIGKYSFVNRTIQDWNQLPAEVLGTLPCKLKTLKKRVRKAIIEVS